MTVTDYANGFIQTYDQFLSVSEFHQIEKELSSLQFLLGETDESNTPPSVLVSELPIDSVTFKSLYSKLQHFDNLKDCYLDRSYVNLYAPNERTYFHHDFTTYTVLYYPNQNWGLNDGGETKFFFTENKFDSIIKTQGEDMPIMISIAPIPNRLVIFNGDVLHSATSFYDKHRHTIAFKFLRNEDD